MTPRIGMAAPRRDVAITGILALVVALALLELGPAPGDAPAHLYRTFLVQHGAVLWDNLWYAGQYPLASYSLLYYFPAAVFGNVTVVLAAVIAAALLFTAIAYHEWGAVARWPARTFGVLAAAPMFTGLYSYSLGLAMLLAAVRLLQRGRTALVLAIAAVTLGVSPLAFVFLCVVLLSSLLARRHVDRTVIALALGLAAIGSAELVVLMLFPGEGVYPFSPYDLAAVLAVCTLGAYLAMRNAGGRLLATFFVVWGVGSIFAFLVPTAVGDNWTRLRSFVFPLMFVAAAQARFRPRLLVAVALAGALTYNLVPYLMLIPYRLDARPAKAQFWRPALAFLAAHETPDFRVEVVPTASHWESYWLPRYGYALARGWYRQLDIEDNPVLYHGHLTPVAYRRWLRQMGIRFVLVPRTVLDPVRGPEEARTVESPSSGLRLVYSGHNWRIYELPHPTPLLTGPRPSRLVAVGYDAVTGVLSGPGTYALRIRFSPYWSLEASGVCLARARGDMTKLVARHAARFALRMPTGFDSLVDAVARSSARIC